MLVWVLCRFVVCVLLWFLVIDFVMFVNSIVSYS